MDFLEGLNPSQRQAVNHLHGPLLILAGAGSGKTRVITHRIGHLIQDHQVDGRRILAVTFTNKAAEEMQGRVSRMLEAAGSSSRPILATFHTFCSRLLRWDGVRLAELRPGFTRRFLIYDEEDQLGTIKSVYRHMELDDSFLPPRSAISRISHAKNQKQTPQDMAQLGRDPKAARLALIYEEYEERLRQANALDFDDLLLLAVRLLRHDDALRQKWNQRLQFLMIDEYQDTNRSQYELMRLLSESHRNVCVVGDEDQSIYSWRGAEIRNILDFEKDFPEAVTIRLEENYRSTGNILEAAGAVVANNQQRLGKWLWTQAPAGELIVVYQAPDAENEALFVAETIDQHLRLHPEDRMAVLYRTNFQSRLIEEALRRYGRPYLVVGGFSFYQRAEVKDVLAYLKLLVNPQDSISLLRIINTPARGIGKTTVEQLEKHAAGQGLPLLEAAGRMLEQGLFATRAQVALTVFQRLIQELTEASRDLPVGKLLRKIVERTGYRRMLENDTSPDAGSRLENLEELINAGVDSAKRGEGVQEFLDHAALISEADALDTRAQVCLLTVHNAKGLEFPVVLIAGLEEGLFPHSRSSESTTLMEEERRLFYVGMTRAQKRLYLTSARARRKYGGGDLEPTQPSRFFDEVPDHLVKRTGAESPRPDELELLAEQYTVRQSVRRNVYTGKTYNSLESVQRFFQERGLPARPSPAFRPAAPKTKKKKLAAGASIEHPSFGRGTVMRREGEGEDVKLTVMFPGIGLKKIFPKYAKLKIDE